jgi:hypothetical protein
MKTFLNNKVIIVLKLVATIIMLQTLFFKFTASPESVYIFSALGLEPVGRIGIGVLELIASILILVPATTVYGAILGAGLMGGALMSHLTKLGIVVMDDGGQLFIYALLVLISCGLLALNYREKVYDLVKLNEKYRA